MSVFLNNVDDYLGPSQACVNPLFTAPPKSSSSNNSSSEINESITTARANAAEQSHADSDMNVSSGAGNISQNKRRIRRRPPPRIIHNEEDTVQRKDPIRLLHNAEEDIATPETNTIDTDASASNKKVKATVTLSDCLSCSGCVTSAEAVLMSHHSVDKFREVAQQAAFRDTNIVFTISTAALADLYRHIYLIQRMSDSDDNNRVCDGDDSAPSNPTRREFLNRIAYFLHSNFGVAVVIDGKVTQQISLLESANEFCYRYRQHKQMDEHEKVPIVQSNCTVTSVALSSTQTRYIKKKQNDESSINVGNDTMEVTTINHPPGRLLESDDDYEVLNNNIQHTQNQTPSVPMLSSSCPGFVCLVEKTAPQVVPLLSSAKSPMSVAGALLKSGMLGAKNKTDSCFHVAVMPCHDKKLEAGRNDFAWERQTLLKYANTTLSSSSNASNNDIVNEVDLVLTTGELLEILVSAAEKCEVNQASTHSSSRAVCEYLELCQDRVSDNFPCLLISDTHADEPAAEDGVAAEMIDAGIHGSGSYADFIFRYAALDLFGCELPQHLPWTNPSNANNMIDGKSSGVIRRRRRRQDTTDLRCVTLYKHEDGSYSCENRQSSLPILHFATAYGFKNVQLILQSLSKEGYTAGALDAKGYDYVEVMACPSGCSNGGGQIGALGQRETPRDTKERVKVTMSLIPVIRTGYDFGIAASSLYDNTENAMDIDTGLSSTAVPFNTKLKGGCFDKSARRLLHTRFHAVPKLELSTGATAGVAISDTNW